MSGFSAATEPVGRSFRRRPGRPMRQRGFTLMEVVVVVVVLGILATLMLEGKSDFSTSALSARLSELRAQLRYVQLSAMKSGAALSLDCDGTRYYAQYEDNSSSLRLPPDGSAQVTLADKSLQMSVFHLYFDSLGIPHDGTTNATLTSALTISVAMGSHNGTIEVSPETGFVQ